MKDKISLRYRTFVCDLFRHGECLASYKKTDFDSVCVCVCVCVELKGQGGMQNNKERVSKIRTPLEHTFQLLWDLRFSRPMKIYVEVFLVCDAV
jgi:hypothetical protein